MKIVIEHSKTKREINGIFNIAGSYEDLRMIARQIFEQTGGMGDGDPSFSYGWIHITEPAPSMPNTKPIAWDEEK